MRSYGRLDALVNNAGISAQALFEDVRAEDLHWYESLMKVNLWGSVWYTHEALPVQSTVGRALVGAGADLVVGGHPHWVQGLESVGDAVIAHSLGNAVFDMDFMEQTMEGVTLTATFRDA